MKTSKKSKSPNGSNSKMTPIAETQERTTLTDTPVEMRKNFLNCDVRTYEDSLTYTKKVIAMALSNIAYLRALWPESFFVTRYFENMELKVIESKSHPQARILTSWILGVFHALERKYLRRFTFSIHLDPKKPEEVIESYEFEISYKDKVNLEITEIREREQKMRSNSIRFIRHLIYAAGMIKEFPEGKGFMNIRLFYYDEVTPVDYQPPGFKSSELFDLNYKDGRVELPVGKLDSFWHVLNFSVNVSKTLVKDYDEYEKAGEVVSRNTDETNKTWMKVDLNRAKKLATSFDQSISSTLEHSLVINSSSELSDSMSTKASKLNVVSDEQQIETNQRSNDKNVDEKIECECGLNEHGNLRLLKCSVCETKQHAVCYRILVPDNESGDEWLRNYKHYCRVCYQQLSLPKPSQVDLAIYRMDDSRVQKFCLLRRVVNYIVSVPEETSFTRSSIGEKLGLDGNTVTELLSEMPKFTVNSKKKGAERSMKISKEDVIAMANEWFTKPLERIRRQNESIKKRSLLESSFEVNSNDETSFLTDVTDLKDKSDLSTSDSTPSEKKVVKSKSPKRHRLSVSGFVKIDGNDDYY